MPEILDAPSRRSATSRASSSTSAPASPTIRRIVKAELAAHGPLTDELIDRVSALWTRQVHVCRMAAVESSSYVRAASWASDIDLIERLLRESRTWALVDGLAASVVGDLVERYPELSETLDRWSADEDFWIKTVAVAPLASAAASAGRGGL